MVDKLKNFFSSNNNTSSSKKDPINNQRNHIENIDSSNPNNL